MNAENEAEMTSLLERLHGYQHADLPARFRELAHSMIIPALEEVAVHVRDAGHPCTVESHVDEPMPATGQAVYLNFDTRYEPGENSLCIRLVPGESVIRIETPGAGAVRAQLVPMSEFAEGNVHRVAIEFLKRATQ